MKNLTRRECLKRGTVVVQGLHFRGDHHTEYTQSASDALVVRALEGGAPSIIGVSEVQRALAYVVTSDKKALRLRIEHHEREHPVELIEQVISILLEQRENDLRPRESFASAQAGVWQSNHLTVGIGRVNVTTQGTVLRRADGFVVPDLTCADHQGSVCSRGPFQDGTRSCAEAPFTPRMVPESLLYIGWAPLSGSTIARRSCTIATPFCNRETHTGRTPMNRP